MTLLCCLIRTFAMLLFMAFHVSAGFAAQGDWSPVSYFVVVQELEVQPANLPPTARAPPTNRVVLTNTGGAFAQTDKLRVFSDVASLGDALAFGGSSIAQNRTLTFTETGAGTHLRRTVDVDGQTVQINSGHSYNRTHTGGDVRDSGLSMDQIDNAIVNDIAANVNVGSLPRVPHMTSNAININGYSLTYDVTRLPNGNVSVSTYYPGP